jgi:hypothetical protein
MTSFEEFFISIILVPVMQSFERASEYQEINGKKKLFKDKKHW